MVKSGGNKNYLANFTSSNFSFLLKPSSQKQEAPFLSAVWRDNNVVNVSCESRGWYPKPSLTWSDQKETLTPNSVKYSKDSNGLLSVHSWLLVSSSSEASCSVSLSGEEAKEARVYLDNPLQPDEHRKENYFHMGSPANWFNPIHFNVTIKNAIFLLFRVFIFINWMGGGLCCILHSHLSFAWSDVLQTRR